MLRIASGKEKGRRLRSLKSLRPTEEQVRQSLFNSLAKRVEGARFLDLFAGTGVVGIEALSRGAKEAWFVDRAKKCVELIKKNLKECNLEEKGRVFLTDVRKVVPLFSKRGERFEIVFLDPPYNKIDLLFESLNLIGEGDILVDEGICIVQHDSHLILPDTIGKLRKFNIKKFGTTTLSFYGREK
ncbi:MAG: 16S rRNA (guanine(966)-N(2))-methyltransferase RsmD [bacterium]